MNIKYSRLSTNYVSNSEHIKWVSSRIPVAFLRQQIFLISIVLTSSLLLMITLFFTSDIEYELIQEFSELNYGVIVDCGSSGSRAYVFRWRQDPETNRVELIRDPRGNNPLSKHITPGLSTLKDTPDKASDYMEPIMNFVSESIPSERHLDTPIYFMATAGLRLLDDSIQKKILLDITRDLRAKYDFPRIKSQVISGALEGVYSWLSLNRNKKIYNITHDSRTYGMLEMGGASTQVTFELNAEVEDGILKELKNEEEKSAFKNEQVTFDIGPNNSVKLFAATFLGLGVNSAREAAIDLLVRDRLNVSRSKDEPKKEGLLSSELHLSDPCLSVGSKEVVSKPITLLEYSIEKSIGLVMKQNEETFQVKLEGSGNFLECLTLSRRVLEAAKKEHLNCPSQRRPCSMDLLGTSFIPYTYYPFIGLSEMFFTTNEMMHSAGFFNRSKVLHETNRICETSYDQLVKLYSNDGVTHQDRMLYECFKASWLLTILNNVGFKMPANYDNFQTVDRLEGEEIDWTKGAIITEVALNKAKTNLS